jgi:uncharacterized repeat protein (TIGR01451 family)
MSIHFNLLDLFIVSRPLRREKLFAFLKRLARLVVAVFGGLVLVSLCQFVATGSQNNVQAAHSLQPCASNEVSVTGSRVLTDTIHDDVVTETYGPLCDYADLEVEKTVNDPDPNEGDVIVYTVVVTNNGPLDATSVQLTDTLPTGVTYDSHTASQGIYTSNLWTIGYLAKDANASLTITTTVNSGTSGWIITNTAHSLTADQAEGDPSNNHASAVITVTGTVTGADLAVDKIVNDPTPAPGDIITYTVTVINNGPLDATSVQLTDALPDGVTFDWYIASQGIYTHTDGLWEIGNLGNTENATLTIAGTVDSGTDGTTITNTAHSLISDQSDPNPDNNEANAVITVTETATGADLAVIKVVSDSITAPGDVITYTVTVINNGLQDTTGVRLIDTLPAGVTFGGYTATQGTYTNTNGLWEIGNLVNTANATLTIIANVDWGTSGSTITNTAHSLISDQPDPNADNNQDSAVIEVTGTATGADLEVSKTVNNFTPAPGDVVTYTVTVTNNGPENATGAQLTDTLPADVTFDWYIASQGIYTNANGLWEIGNLANSGNVTLTIVATVDGGTGGSAITNTAHSLISDQPDPIPENNSASAAIIPESTGYFIYLPLISKEYEPIICDPYFDDFSNPGSGWVIDDSGDVRTGYSKSEEYFINRQMSGMRIVQAPTDFASRYSVEVDARWDSAYRGYEYGLVFGQVSFPAPTYLLGVDSVGQRYRLFRILRYDGNEITWQCITEPCWIDSLSINRGSTPNHLKAECDGTTIRLYVNDVLLWQDDDLTSCGGSAGLFAQSSPSDLRAIAYFDNFQINCPFGANPAYNINTNRISPDSTMSLDLEMID